MRIAQLYFTKKFFKNNESIFLKKNPTLYISNQLSLYYYWWGYQNTFKKTLFITNSSTVQLKKTIFIYQV